MAIASLLRKIVVVIACLLPAITSLGQSTFTLKYFGLTIHPMGDRTASLQPYKLDRHALFVLNFGGFAGYERFVYKDLVSVKFIQGVFTDCSGGWASVSHMGARLLVFERPKHRIYFGVGPTLIIRDSWERFGTAYQPSGYFNTGHLSQFGDIQWKFIVYGCEFEYDYRCSERNHLSVSFTPGVPMACVFSVGWKHWFSQQEYDYDKLYIPRR